MSDVLKDTVALVAGATRETGRGIAVQLGAAGATVYVTGRTTQAQESEMNRGELFEQPDRGVTARKLLPRDDEFKTCVDDYNKSLGLAPGVALMTLLRHIKQ